MYKERCAKRTVNGKIIVYNDGKFGEKNIMTKQTECRNGCGRILEWDNNQPGKYKFVEAATGQLHRCPNYVSKQTSDFERNKQMYGGPSLSSGYNQMQKDLADMGVWKDGAELRIRELEKEANRYIELTDAIAKELKIKSFKPASELEQEENEKTLDE